MSEIKNIIYPIEFDERAAYEAESRGYQGEVIVEFNDGNKFEIYFYDLCRLEQDLEEEVISGNGFVADAGMIILKSITKESMESAIKRLELEGYFVKFKPIN